MIFNTLFDNIYVLNLKKSIDRKEHIINEFKRVGIEKYNFFEATPHDSEEVNNLMKSDLVKKFPNCFRCNKKRCNCENNYLTPFQIGNWCSFLNIFKDIILKNYKFVLICEDDIVFSFQYKRIIDKLLCQENFKKYKINMDNPLLIRLGTAFNPDNHNSSNHPIFLRNYSLCNPCFAINKSMAIIYLKYLKVIDYHSDVYFHQKIPKNIHGIQFFTMYPYPIYELSFVKSKQKFESLIRPISGFRRIEYKDFLLLSSNHLLEIFLKNIIKIKGLNIGTFNIGYHGNLNYFLLSDENLKNKYYFENKILLVDNYENDIKIINSNKIIYKIFLKKIKEIYGIDIDLNSESIDYSKLLYEYLMKLMNIENILIININNLEDLLKLSLKMNLKIDIIQKYILIYKNLSFFRI
jgi:GR25 family glycosyltransferase involved in LPS biosynthesis